VSDGKNLQSIADVPEDNTVIAYPQTVTPLALTVQRIDLAGARGSKARNMFQDP